MNKIAVHTHYTYTYESLAAIVIPVLQKYCDKNGYDLHIRKSHDKFHFVKSHHLRELLEEYDLVLSIELDILITNLTVRFEDFINDTHDIFICKDINDYNGGCMITKSTEKAKRIIDLVNLNIDDFGDEQMFFEKYGNVYHSIIKVLPHPSINSVPYEYYYPSYGKIGFKDGDIIEKPTEEQGCWNIGHFNCHLPGMELSKRIEIFNKIKDFIIYE